MNTLPRNTFLGNTPKKYELTNISYVSSDGSTLYRIRALIDIPYFRVKAGDLGGFIQSEKNLSHEGNCWVKNNSLVCQDAVVQDNACIYDYVEVCGKAIVKGNSSLYDNVKVSGEALIQGTTNLFHALTIRGNARIGNDSPSWKDVTLIMGYMTIEGSSVIRKGSYHVCNGFNLLFPDLRVHSEEDFIHLKNIGEKKLDLTVYVNTDKRVIFLYDDFRGDSNEFDSKISSWDPTHRSYTYMVKQLVMDRMRKHATDSKNILFYS